MALPESLRLLQQLLSSLASRHRHEAMWLGTAFLRPGFEAIGTITHPMRGDGPQPLLEQLRPPRPDRYSDRLLERTHRLHRPLVAQMTRLLPMLPRGIRHQ